ncbi:hypothetical protein BZA70DRAFT_185263 [Myxozyma melibiosi]|uniref:Ribosomal protein S13 n=1 Tax=Myxozyma melibiosi TaxID=54550 RepID=A0ABR1F4S4_9ASCO
MTIRFQGISMRGNALVKLVLVNRFTGLGRHNAERICAKLGFYPRMRAHQLQEPDLLALAKELQGYTVGEAYTNSVRDNIRSKRIIGTFAGRRHALGYPVKGQRTKNNGLTARRHNRGQWDTEKRKFTTLRQLDLAPSVSTVVGTWAVNAAVRAKVLVDKIRFW